MGDDDAELRSKGPVRRLGTLRSNRPGRRIAATTMVTRPARRKSRERAFPAAPGTAVANGSRTSIPELRPLLVLNLIATVGGLSLLILWIALETPWLPLISSFVGLSGLLVWGAMLLKLVDEPSQRALAYHMQATMGTSVPIAAIALLLLAAASFDWLTSTIVVDMRSDNHQRSLGLAFEGSPEWPLVAPSPGRRTIYVVYQGRHREAIQVFLAGLPPVTIKPGGFDRPVIRSPTDFMAQPIVLVRPTPDITRFGAAGGIFAFFSVNERPSSPHPFDGRAFWIGGKGDIEVPSDIIRAWELALLADGTSTEWIARWLPARSIAPSLTLRRGDRISVSLRNAYGDCYAFASDVIPKAYGPTTFPMQLTLEVASSESNCS